MRFKCINKRKPKHGKMGSTNNNITHLNILYANVRGIKGKAHDLEHKLAMHETHISTLTETKLGSIPPRLEGYTWITKNRKEGAGGIACIINNTLKNITTVPQYLDEDETEVLWVEVGTKPKPTFVGVVYGKQESAPVEEVERQFQTLTTHIHTLKQKGKVILTGDLNAKINIQSQNYNNTAVNQKTSRNGKMLEKMLEDTKTIAISTYSKTGLWTRVNTKNPEEKSIIDYIIIPEEDANLVTNIEVDESETYRITGENKSDHNTILLTTKTTSHTTEEKKTSWKVDNKEGWKKFNLRLEEENSQKKILGYEQFQEQVIQLLKETIGEKITRQCTKPKRSEDLKKAHEEKRIARKEFKTATKAKTTNIKEKLDKYIQVQKNIKTIIEKENKLQLEKTLEKFINEGGIQSQSFWKIRKKIMGQGTVECEIISENDEIITDPDRAKETVAKYFENLYQARPAVPEEKDRTQTIIKNNMEMKQKTQKIPKEEEITEKELKKAIEKLRRHKSTGPDKIPNELFIEANKNTRDITRRVFTEILQKKIFQTHGEQEQ